VESPGTGKDWAPEKRADDVVAAIDLANWGTNKQRVRKIILKAIKAAVRDEREKVNIIYDL